MRKIQYAFYFDQTRCMACNSCSVACKDYNGIQPGLVNWRKQFTYETRQGYMPFSMGCNHCEKPACMEACDAGAISKDDMGFVIVDRNKCVQLESCVFACPYGKPKIADDRQEPTRQEGWQTDHPMQKCTMCRDKVLSGEKPTCVAACVGRAMDFGPLELLQRRYPDAVRVTAADFGYLYENSDEDTLPSILVKKKTATLRVHTSPHYKY